VVPEEKWDQQIELLFGNLIMNASVCMAALVLPSKSGTHRVEATSMGGKYDAGSHLLLAMASSIIF